MFNAFLFAHEKLLSEYTLMKQNVKQNKVHDEQNNHSDQVTTRKV